MIKCLPSLNDAEDELLVEDDEDELLVELELLEEQEELEELDLDRGVALGRVLVTSMSQFEPILHPSFVSEKRAKILRLFTKILK